MEILAPRNDLFCQIKITNNVRSDPILGFMVWKNMWDLSVYICEIDNRNPVKF